MPHRHAVLAFLVLVQPTVLPAQAPLANASGGELRPAQACYDVLHYELALRVDPAEQRIDGSLQLRAKVVTTCSAIELDLDQALRVERVSVFDNAGLFTHQDGRIVIELGAEHPAGTELLLVVHYGGRPRVAKNPPWSGGFTWAKTGDGRPWIATSCQGEGADLWWPCKDHPSDKPDGVDLRITVPKDLVVASNGVLVDDAIGQDGWRTFHWQVRSPISNYCIALNIAPYRELRDTYTSVTGEKVPFVLYVLPEALDDARPFVQQFQDHLRWFEKTLGPYPFRHEKYGVAHTPHLGMEHQSIIAYGNGFRDRDYDWLHHHELAHEWWGNLVTCRDWKDMWIHEGFGTYMQALYLESVGGAVRYQREVGRWRALNRGPVAPREVRSSQQIYFGPGGSNDIYFKGALVLHTLRWLLGDESFRQSLREFCYPTEAARKATDGTQVRLVDTGDFVALCTRLHGEDLGWYFDAMVHEAQPPRLEEEVKDGVLHLRWRVPGDRPFPLPVPVQVGGKDGKVVRVAMPDGAGSVRVGERAATIDPDGWLGLLRPRTGR